MRLVYTWLILKMNKLAIIGGSALPKLVGFKQQQQQQPQTPFGLPSSPLLYGTFAEIPVIFFDRHGPARDIPPHLINYRANMWALAQAGITHVIGLSIVGGIRADMTPGHFVFPDQLIDYTHGRPYTCFPDTFDGERHLDFSYPYCPALRQLFIDAAQGLHLRYSDDATYAVSQGPRFETVAEINRFERDGCDVVGMTAMPEALLARELGMRYSSIAVVGAKAAGRSDGRLIELTDIRRVVDDSLLALEELLQAVVHSGFAHKATAETKRESIATFV